MNTMKAFKTASLAAVVAAIAAPALAACPDGQQSFFTSDGGTPPAAVENCVKVRDIGHGGVAWTGNLDKHLSPVLVDHDSDPATPDQQLVIDGQPIVTATNAGNGDHQHDKPVVKGIDGVAVGNGAMIGEFIPASDGGTPDDPSDDTPAHYRYVDGGTAIGAGAKVTHAGSTAIGRGAASSAENQIALGTSAETIRAQGITSDLSRSRQSGSLEVVTTDANGNLASDGGALFNQIGEYGSRLDAQAALLSQHGRRLDRLEKGLAAAIALPDLYLSDKERFSVAGNVGGFGDEVALGFGAIARVSDSAAITGKFAADADFEEFAWTVGGRLGW